MTEKPLDLEAVERRCVSVLIESWDHLPGGERYDWLKPLRTDIPALVGEVRRLREALREIGEHPKRHGARNLIDHATAVARAALEEPR